MGCIFRVGGVDLDVDACLRACQLEGCHLYRKGEPYGKRGQLRQHSGFSITISHADWDDLPGQIEDAIRFLTKNASELEKLSNFPDVEDCSLDFPVEDRNAAVQFDKFPAKLLKLAGNLGIAIEISHYD